MKAVGRNRISSQGAADDVFRALADATPAPIWITRPEGGVDFVNQAFVDLTGLPRERLLGDAWVALMHPDDAPAVGAQRAEVIALGYAPYQFVARFRDASGNWRWMRANAQPRFSAEGAFEGYVGMALDETAAHRALADLRESDERLKLVQEAGGIGSFDWDMRTGEVYRSSQYLELQGLPPDLPLKVQYDESWIHRLHPDDRDAVAARVRAHHLKPGPFEFEYRIVRPDNGETRWILNRGRVEAGPDGKPARVLSAQSDITRQKTTEFDLRRVGEKVRQPSNLLRMISRGSDVRSTWASLTNQTSWP